MSPISHKLETLKSALESVFGDKIKRSVVDRGELTVTVAPADWLALGTALRDHEALKFEQLIDLCGLDYSAYREGEYDGPRYCVVSHLQSLSKNWRLRVKVFCADDDLPVLPSITPVWNSANWFEREAFDLYGIIFDGHLDLRRLLTDYGFIGHPFRKDFPVSGNVEMRYDEAQQRVIYQPVTIEPREIVPRVIREDNYGGLH
jgi:NADH-quinone oxidoreductase subunit C